MIAFHDVALDFERLHQLLVFHAEGVQNKPEICDLQRKRDGTREVLTEKKGKKKCSGTIFPKKALHVLNHGWWRLAVGGWRLAVGGWQLVVGGGWRLVVGSGWQLAVGRRWRLAAVGGWRSLAKKKNPVP